LAALAARTLAGLALSLVAGIVHAADAVCPGDRSGFCAEASPWYQATALVLRFSDQTTGESGRWSLAIQDPGNMQIDAQSRRAGKINAGKIMLVSGRVMLTRGLSLEKGLEVDVLNEPLLYYQLLAALLGRVFPDGPGVFKDAMVVGVEEAVRGIRFATPSAMGYIAPPWSASGVLKRRDRSTVDFSLKLDFYFEPDDTRRAITLRGSWQRAPRAPALPSEMSLQGWQAHAIGRARARQEALAILDHRPRTLGELQAALRASTPAPGEPAKP
jgi:hypothetical protein